MHTMNAITTLPGTRAALPSIPRSAATATTAVWRELLALISEWNVRSYTRAQAQGLDDRMLRDIGLTRAEVLAEADKPFWQA
jgi:uncharacterized protein YjiS (DUF1127 family)